MIHRDIKPENILLSDGQAVVGSRSCITAYGALSTVFAYAFSGIRTPLRMRFRIRSEKSSMPAIGTRSGVSMILPIGNIVDFSWGAVFGDTSMSVARLCFLYLLIAPLYGGIPMAVAAYKWRDRREGLRTGLVKPLFLQSSQHPCWSCNPGYANG